MSTLQFILIVNGVFDIVTGIDVLLFNWFKFHAMAVEDEDAEDEDNDALAAWIMTYGAIRLFAGLFYPLRPLIGLATITYGMQSMYYQKREKLGLAMVAVVFMQFTLYG